jgi:uncharacterized protein YeaO (DUF488 family)
MNTKYTEIENTHGEKYQTNRSSPKGIQKKRAHTCFSWET